MHIEVRIDPSNEPRAGEYSIDPICPEARQSVSFQRLTQDWKRILADAKEQSFSSITVRCPDDATRKLCKQVYNFWYPSDKKDRLSDPLWED